jgi:type I restriction enzyme S subunit
MNQEENLARLRFPQFQTMGPWRIQQLNRSIEERRLRNRDLLFGPAEVLSVSGEYGCVNQIEHLGRSYAGANLKEYHVVELGDLVYTKSPLKRNPFGIIKANRFKRGIVSTLYAVYRPLSGTSSTFLDYYFQSDHRLNTYLRQIVHKGAKNDMKVNNSEVLTGNICLPEESEQKVIADCLDSANALLFAEKQKLVTLKQYRKGVLQRLFPQSVDDSAKDSCVSHSYIPRVRFRRFIGSGSWYESSVGSLFLDRNERGVIRNPVLAATQDRGVVPYNELGKTVVRSGDNLQNYKLVEIGDFVISLRSFEGGFEYSKVRGIISPAYVVLAKRKPLNEKFFESLFKSDVFLRTITNALNPNLRDGKSISYATASAMKLVVPANEEMQEIGSYLCSIDNLIANQAKKVEVLKDHKRGLMNALFPSFEDLG